ncbi:hypothetical protein VST7929_01314 [Vibrio stylophorae]|uniref:YbjN domain-containing protein n=1 Tax=Vibrio stylophorae TaxID=659351 RepID=A0ABN8DQJ5_9VIBR|nr:YbjN domain-containing protein [Vibrio stylophorae]CAH0533446.1 hypothetical protein VST7929_01314 [Vibrio stylophorae]
MLGLKKLVQAGVFAATALVASTGFAQGVTEFTDQQLVKILKEGGHEQTILVRKGIVAVRLPNRSAFLIKNRGVAGISAYYAMGVGAVPLDEINLWNKKNRFARIYLDADGDPVMEADLYSFDGAFDDEEVIDFVKFFLMYIKPYHEFVIANITPVDPKGTL